MAKRRPDPEDLLGPTDASHVLSASVQTVRNLADKGVLPYRTTVGGNRLFRRADVERVAAERRKGPKKSEG